MSEKDKKLEKKRKKKVKILEQRRREKSRKTIDKFSTRLRELFKNKASLSTFENLKLRPDVKKYLFSYQLLHVFNLITAMKRYNSALDASSTGTGKTYTSIAMCKQMRLKPIIICPKSSRTTWKNVCKRFDVEPICVVNYELLRNCKIYDDDKKIEAPFLKKENGKYVWDIKDKRNTILIYDEAHHCKNYGSLLGKLLFSSKFQCKILLISATLCDKIEDFLIFGYVLGLYGKLASGRGWIKNIINNDTKKLEKVKTSGLHKYLFPIRGSKMDIEELEDSFPKNQIITECYDIDSKLIKKLNKNLKISKKLRKSKDKDHLIEISDARQEIEKIKTPIIYEELIKYYEANKSVVVFVNFLKTIDKLSEKLDKAEIKYSVIKGGQTEEERNKNKDLFQYNRVHVLLCTMGSGNESIDLHDKFGKHPRVSLISPSMSSVQLIQSMGRTYRSECKSPCTQKLIFCAGTYEERIAELLKQKSKFIDKLTDDDMIL